jgi:hypothetical protein
MIDQLHVLTFQQQLWYEWNSSGVLRIDVDEEGSKL